MKSKMNVIVIGDSIVYGMGDYEKGGWVNRLRLMLENHDDYYYDVYNLGIPDDTSKDVLNRFANEIGKRFFVDDCIVIFGVGANDSILPAYHLGRFRDNVSGLITIARQYTDKVFFLGLLDSDDVESFGRFKQPITVKDKYVEMFNNAIERVCHIKDCRFIPMRGLLNISQYVDGIHPDPDGHQKIAETVYNYIREVIDNEKD